MCVPNGCSPRLRAGRSIELADSKFLGPGPASFDDVQLPGCASGCARGCLELELKRTECQGRTLRQTWAPTVRDSPIRAIPGDAEFRFAAHPNYLPRDMFRNHRNSYDCSLATAKCE